MSSNATVTLPASEYLALMRVCERVKAHILEEHIERIPNHYQFRCGVCGTVHDSPEDLLRTDHEDCWVGVILEFIAAGAPHA